MSSITKLNKNLMVSPVCTHCVYCSGCEVRNTGSDTEDSSLNDIITGYFCTNPRICGPDIKEVNVNIRPNCPLEQQSDGWTYNSRMQITYENDRLKHLTRSLIWDNKNLEAVIREKEITISEKEKTIERFTEASRLAAATCSTLFLAAANGILETDDDEAEDAKTASSETQNSETQSTAAKSTAPASSAKPKEANK